MALDERLYDILTGDEEGRICRDIPEDLCAEQPANFLIHTTSIALTRLGDGLADPKLVLAWLMGALGAPAGVVGLLVPVRESLSLLPQLVIAGIIRRMPIRKWVWVAGSTIQGIAVIAMGIAALLLEGATAGWTIIALLALFAIARSASSVSHKDVLGKTVSKSTRGTAKGTSGSIAAVAVLGFGALLAFDILPLTVNTIAGALFVGGSLWLVAALVFSTLSEVPGATGGGGNALAVARAEIRLFRDDPQLVRLIVTRGLLIATALAPPFLVALAGQEGNNALDTLGPFVVASSTANFLGSYAWGRLADRSSRKVLMAAATIGAFANLGALGVAAVFDGSSALPAAMAVVLFILMIGYQGVRLGRSTHIIDMATEETRAAYTALSNTAVGLLLVAGGGFGLLAQYVGEEAVLLCFAAMCAAAILVAAGLREVQRR